MNDCMLGAGRLAKSRAAHPQHNRVIACRWIKCREEHPVRTNTGRQRLNINGAIDLDRSVPVVRLKPSPSSKPRAKRFSPISHNADGSCARC
jgi:hypothetical protein